MYEPITHTYTPDNFYAGSAYPHINTAKPAAAPIAKYAPVIIKDGKVAPAVTVSEGEDGAQTSSATTEGLYGVSLEEATAADQTIAVALTGEILASALVLPEGASAADFELEFRKLGIFLK